MSAPKALGWDKIACLFFQVLGRLAHQLQIRPDSAWIILVVFSFFLPWWVSSGGKLKFSPKRATSGLVGLQLLKSVVLLLLLKLVMSCLWRWVVSHVWCCYWACRHSAWFVDHQLQLAAYKGKLTWHIWPLNFCFHFVPSGNRWSLDNLRFVIFWIR